MGGSKKGTEEWWQQYLTQGHQLEGIARVLFPRLPGGERCKVCSVPFGGFGRIFRLFGWAPSSKNPRLCGFCSDRLPAGGANVQVAVLVADVRGYTSMSERLSGQEVAAKMNRFFESCTSTLMEHDALIDKYLGDAVQALFLPGIAGADYVRSAVRAALALSKEFQEAGLPVGVGIHCGEAFVGNVGIAGIIDLTAMGDVVNTVHRLQGMAAPGEVIVTDAVYESFGADSIGEFESGWSRLDLELKGKTDKVIGWVTPDRSQG